MIHSAKRLGSLSLAFFVLTLSACSQMTPQQQSYSHADKTRYCRPGNGVVFRTTNPENVDPIRLLKEAEHGCR